jgi:peptide/nickel transport system ATP-binding protein
MTPSKAPLLEVRNLSKRFVSYGSLGRQIHTTTALENVSFDAYEGRILGVVGESGSGKTTLVRCLGGLEAPTAGSIEYHGGSGREIQLVFQGTSLNPRLRIHRSLGEALRNRGIPRKEHRARGERLLDLVGLPPGVLDRFPGQLSGGQRQRVAIARALAMEPKVLLLDEPVSNLDVSVQARVVNLLLDLQEELGLTLVVVSHDLTLICYLSHHIVVLRDGRIVEEGETHAVFTAPTHPYTRRLLESAALVDRKDDN